MLIAPVRTSSNRPPIALGRPAAMPAKIRIEMPLPRPRSVICSPSHIRNIVPDDQADHRGEDEAAARVDDQARRLLQRRGNAARDWKIASSSVP